MNNFEKIKEAIDEKMAEIETYNGMKRPNSYFELERLLKDYGWGSWRRGADAYGKEAPTPK